MLNRRTDLEQLQDGEVLPVVLSESALSVTSRHSLHRRYVATAYI